MKRAVVIGSGFAGLSSACYLAKAGYQVELVEKNEGPGGRASVFEAEGFTYDMGPSWYWMPGVFDDWFADFGHKASDFYELERMDPSYRVWFGSDDYIDVPADRRELTELFEKLEPGSGPNLKRFLDEAAYKYETGINDLVQRPSRSLMEFADFRLLKGLFKMQLFSSYRSHVASLFKNDRIRKILEFPVYFLGGTPSNTPALYSLMSYADLELGTWYPKGGMHKIIAGMVSVAKELGVKFSYDEPVQELRVASGAVRKVVTAKRELEADVVVASADYHHIEQQILEPQYRKYSESYWDKRVMAPSSLIFYLGVDHKLPAMLHHNLFFDTSFDRFADEIYTKPRWPKEPLFYVNCTSKTDATAPEGMENVYILVPLAPGLEDTPEARQEVFDKVMDRIEKRCGENLRDSIVYRRDFAHKDFIERYNAFKGNAYGLANTLRQTAIFKPSLKNPKLSNLYFSGQLTVPGPGVPPSLISGKVVAGEIAKEHGTFANSPKIASMA